MIKEGLTDSDMCQHDVSRWWEDQVGGYGTDFLRERLLVSMQGSRST